MPVDIHVKDTSGLRIRNASSAGSDTQFIVAAWDSTLPYLASIGSGEMWGAQPFSEKDGFFEDIADIIQKSEVDISDDSRRLLIVEVVAPCDGRSENAPVAAAMIRDALPYYLTERQELASEVNRAKSLLFLEVLISDHRSHPRFEGAGAALVEATIHRAREKGKVAVYVDVWAGNERKLNRYYEDLGFSNVGEFSLTRGNGSTWLGTLYRLSCVPD